MVSHKIILPALVSSLVFGLQPVAPAQNDAPESSEALCPPGIGILTAREIPKDVPVDVCGLVGRVVQQNGLSAPIPSAGNSVTATAFSAKTARSLRVSTDLEGKVTVENPDATAAARQQSMTAKLPACSDDAYTVFGFKQYTTKHWYVGDGARPDGMSTATVVSRLRDSIGNITNTTNTCGLGDRANVSSSYQGISSNESDMVNSGGEVQCTSPDGVDVVDFGNLDHSGDPWVGYACMWSTVRKDSFASVYDADIRFNVRNHNFTNTPGTSCAGEYDLESVATHEFGHNFGLDHVLPEDVHGNLTMGPGITACTSRLRTLGWGDVSGLRILYN